MSDDKKITNAEALNEIRKAGTMFRAFQHAEDVLVALTGYEQNERELKASVAALGDSQQHERRVLAQIIEEGKRVATETVDKAVKIVAEANDKASKTRRDAEAYAIKIHVDADALMTDAQLARDVLVKEVAVLKDNSDRLRGEAKLLQNLIAKAKATAAAIVSGG